MMKTDVNGCSTTKAGQERHEEFKSPRGKRVQYDYRTPQGKLFSCVANSLAEARQRRDNWLAKMYPTPQLSAPPGKENEPK